MNNTQVSGTSSYQGVLPPIEAIQEFSIDSSNSLPELGRGGTNIRVTLKSGTNNLHGSIFRIPPQCGLERTQLFDRKTPGSDRGEPNDIQNQFGGTLGGPIIKNKTFFFADYQGLRQREGRTWVSTARCFAAKEQETSAEPRRHLRSSDMGCRHGDPPAIPGQSDPGKPNQSSLAEHPEVHSLSESGSVTRLGQGIVDSSSVIRRTQDAFDVKIDHHAFGQGLHRRALQLGPRSTRRIPGAWTDLPGDFPAAQGGAATAGWCFPVFTG